MPWRIKLKLYFVFVKVKTEKNSEIMSVDN